MALTAVAPAPRELDLLEHTPTALDLEAAIYALVERQEVADETEHARLGRIRARLELELALTLDP